MNSVNVVNVGERMGSATFITYPDETKRLVNVVNVVGKYFGSRARQLHQDPFHAVRGPQPDAVARLQPQSGESARDLFHSL